MTILDDKTKVPLYAIAAALPFIIVGILWLSSVASDAKEAKSKAQELKVLVEDTHDRVIRIEEYIRLLKRSK